MKRFVSLVLLCFLIALTVPIVFATTDDWAYDAQAIGQYSGYAQTYSSPHSSSVWSDAWPFVIGLLPIIGFLACGIIVLVQGLRRADRNRLIAGIGITAGFLLSLGLVLFGIFDFEFFAFIGILLFFGVVVWGIIFGSLRKIRLVKVASIVMIVLLIVGGLGLVFVRSMFGAGTASLASVEKSGMGMMDAAPMAQNGNIGLAVGGANDVNNFRENIDNGYVPLTSDITYEGLFYDYFFDTGLTQQCTNLFCPSYDLAVTADPFSGEDDYYLSVGLNSNIKESDFERKKLNLVVVLDISGSMGSSFNKYYYDGFDEESEEWDTRSKMQIAAESVVALMDHLQPEDSFGIVLFDSAAYLGKPLNLVEDTDMQAIKDHVLEIRDRGGTNMEAGYRLGSELFENVSAANKDEYENRIIFLTDAMPNTGRTDEESLVGMTQENADDGIYTTFIGVGVDFNTQLVELITKVQGANYYSVHSGEDFKTRMDDEFEFMVTPLVFDLLLELDADGFDIQKVYGSPEADEATGQIMKVNTLFPSASHGGQTKGGIIVLKLHKKSADASISIVVSYKDRSGEKFEESKEVLFDQVGSEYFGNDGLRKAVLLSRYADIIKQWIIDERKANYESKVVRPMYDYYEEGIMVPPVEVKLGQWERQSLSLHVSEQHQQVFSEFAKYFDAQMAAIGDESLQQELDILNTLAIS